MKKYIHRLNCDTGETIIEEVEFDYTDEELAEQAAQAAFNLREQAKISRQQAVDNIKVTTQAGNTFDGDETSQTRMTRAIIGMQAAGVATITWTLADNTVVQATQAELTEALSLAGQRQTELWVI